MVSAKNLNTKSYWTTEEEEITWPSGTRESMPEEVLFEMCFKEWVRSSVEEGQGGHSKNLGDSNS